MLHLRMASARDRFEALAELSRDDARTLVVRDRSGGELKILELIDAPDAATKTAFLQRATEIIALADPMIPMREAFEHGQAVAVVSDYLPGAFLTTNFSLGRQENALRLGARLRILVDVLACLSSLHGIEAGLKDTDRPHGAVFPENILVGQDGRARVVRMFAIYTASPNPSLVPPPLAGSPPGARDDLYSVGVLLWTALASRSPFEGMTPEQVREAYIKKLFPKAPATEPWAAQLAEVAQRAMTGRYACAAQMTAEIRTMARGRLARHQEVEEHVASLAGAEIYARQKRLSTAVAFAINDEPPTPPQSKPRLALPPAVLPPHRPGAKTSAATPVVAFDPVPIDEQTLLRPSVSKPPVVPRFDHPLFAPSLPPLAPTPSLAPAATASSPLFSKPAPALGSTHDPQIVPLDEAGTAAPLDHPAFKPRSKVRLAAYIGVPSILAIVGLGLLGSKRSAGDRAANAAATSATVPTAVQSAANVGVARTPRCPDGMIFMHQSTFRMGAEGDGAARDERPSHKVTVSDTCIDKHEVTTAQFKACSDSGECKRGYLANDWAGITANDRKAFDALCTLRDPEKFRDYPINCIDWERADIYCKARGGRLPTEAEWELAALGPEGSHYPWPAEPNPKLMNGCGSECVAWGKANGLDLHAMYQDTDHTPTLAKVGSFPAGASPLGALDLEGNVSEWVGDWYASYASDTQTDPVGPSDGSARVVRGASWETGYAALARLTARHGETPSTRSHAIGFRCVARPLSSN